MTLSLEKEVTNVPKGYIKIMECYIIFNIIFLIFSILINLRA